jgi:hypothetical protein
MHAIAMTARLTRILSLLSILLPILVLSRSGAAPGSVIEYQGKAPEGLVGNGRSVVRVRPGSYMFHSGGLGKGTFGLIVDGNAFELVSPRVHSMFFPGGVQYTLLVAGLTVDVLHCATERQAYVCAIRVKGKPGKIALDLHQEGEPGLLASGRIDFPKRARSTEVILATAPVSPDVTYEQLLEASRKPYLKGFSLQSPAPLVDRAIPFNRYLLDLGFDGKLHVCEIFRWRDVWSRDLGSGLVPGALAAGQFSRARTTIEYDLNRYATHNPGGLKVTEDPSQGGSAEGTAWLTKAVWRYYLLTGDADFLKRAVGILAPWVDAWIARDSRGEGVLVDVTEWMDHSRFFLFPDGARVLYSNVLFANCLSTFALMERELGDAPSAARFEGVKERFVSGINRVLWNQTNGEYDNLSMWGKQDKRSSSAENALAIYCGVAPRERIPRILDAVRRNNWRAAGSTTIYPPMTHVDTTIDHNYKMWPWWNALEALVRLRNGDIPGGIHLLECCSRTLEDEHFPGLMEELTTPQGITEGGNAFLTAAGSYQNAIVEGLLGIDILEAGCKRIRVSPNTPPGWRNWSATVPLPEGEVRIVQKKGRLAITVTDPRVRVIEAPEGANVHGAARASIAPTTFPLLVSLPEVSPSVYPPFVLRNVGVFHDTGFCSLVPPIQSAHPVTIDDLLRLDSMNVSALVVPGNALPIKTRAGQDIRPALSAFLDRGNAIVFYGATMHDRGTMGETGGVVDWYDYRRNITYTPLLQWKFKASPTALQMGHDKELGLTERWSQPNYGDGGWDSINVPAPWEEHLHKAYDGWGWYRTHFQLPANAKGKSVLLDLGEVDDIDWTFVNGRFIGSEAGWQRFRRYALRPEDSSYSALKFGGDNILAVQVFDGGGTGGLYTDTVRIGVETDELAWMPIDARTGMTRTSPVRFGVISWGPGGDFFNSWETSRGAFGFRIDGSGIEFGGPLAGMGSLTGVVQEAFTDFAVSAPLMFQPLAFTTTHRGILYPDQGERYPCMARVVDSRTGGEFFLIPASIVKTPAGPDVLRHLGIK